MTPPHVVVLRHGSTDLAAQGRYTSTSDVDLDMAGRAAAAAWADTFHGVDVLVLCSPSRRAAETARLVGLVAEVDADLGEWDLGDLEGKVAEDYREAHPDWQLFRDGAPGGETVESAVARADRVVARLAEAGPRPVVLVGHGQLSKLVATRLLGLPADAAVRMSWGAARVAVFSRRASLDGYLLAGWNRTPVRWPDLVGGNA